MRIGWGATVISLRGWASRLASRVLAIFAGELGITSEGERFRGLELRHVAGAGTRGPFMTVGGAGRSGNGGYSTVGKGENEFEESVGNKEEKTCRGWSAWERGGWEIMESRARKTNAHSTSPSPAPGAWRRARHGLPGQQAWDPGRQILVLAPPPRALWGDSSSA